MRKIFAPSTTTFTEEETSNILKELGDTGT